MAVAEAVLAWTSSWSPFLGHAQSPEDPAGQSETSPAWPQPESPAMMTKQSLNVLQTENLNSPLQEPHNLPLQMYKAGTCTYPRLCHHPEFYSLPFCGAMYLFLKVKLT